MKMEKIYKGVIAFVVILSLSIGVVHATIGTRIGELVYENIKIILNGENLIPVDANGNEVEPFTIDGTTYLPVRGIASAMGLEVQWDDETKTVELNTPGIFPGAVQVYDDKNVTIEFAGCVKQKPFEYAANDFYYANFNIKNKTDMELTFQPDAISFNGLSFSSFMGSENVAPKSTGQISFYTQTPIITTGIYKTSGTISVIDFSYEYLETSYDAKWVDVTQ